MSRFQVNRPGEARFYAESNYDHDGCLKPPLLLWLAVIYLSRAILLPLTIGLGHVAGVNAEAMVALRGFWNAQLFIPCMLAFPVLYALLRRAPTASSAVRFIWAHGRALLTAAAVADIALTVVLQIWHGASDDSMLSALFGTAIDAYFLLYVVAARRVRETFREFPATVVRPHP